MPSSYTSVRRQQKPSKLPGQTLVGINITPHSDQASISVSPFCILYSFLTIPQFIEKGMLDKWDYILRRLYVLKTYPLKSAIGCVRISFRTHALSR